MNSSRSANRELALGDTMISLRGYVDDLALTPSVRDLLIPNGKPHDGETQLWDYKEDVPILHERPNEDQRRDFNAEIGDLIKDAVSFHNAYGGYIVFGVKNKGGDRTRGVSGDFDCGDFNNRLKSYIGDAEIECYYSRIGVPGKDVDVGLLLIPRRPTDAPPVRFLKDGPKRANGEKCFNKETYVRVRDQCRPAASTTTDWAFLHSDRASPERGTKLTRRAVVSNLPARDPDMVKFIGREGSLTRLRAWMLDQRSPIRLVTGIGGLGKTSLAYRFAEEVAELGVGEVGQIVWLTAKEQTFSALNGRMVPIGRVDFSDIFSLQRAILRALRYDFPLGADEPDLEDMEERVIEALSIEPSLIIVDDIDSLTPDQQRAVVSSLNKIALRTVGRELSSSKILMTSRIDQGMPDTSVIKLEGLGEVEFGLFVSEICHSFGISVIYGDTLIDLHRGSSGSPLFAASILRLVKLGESATAVLKTWEGEDGEEVRAFAFEREISRLEMAAARLLYSVILLGETSVEELAAVMEITARAVRERVAKLQAYHLIATASPNEGVTKIVVSNDLVAVTALIKAHLGEQAASVEDACARVSQREINSTGAIGHGIRSITAQWKLDRFQEALVLARRLSTQFPKNGDVACLLGAAFLKISPPDAISADRELVRAMALGCTRPELLPYLIHAKTIMQDWQGLYTLTAKMMTNDDHRDVPLDAHIVAATELMKVAQIRGDLSRAVELAVGVVEQIQSKFRRQKVVPTYFRELTEKKSELARIAMDVKRRLSSSAGDQLDVFETMFRLTEADVYLGEVVRAGIYSLEVWWAGVEARPLVDRQASELLAKQLRRLDKIERAMRQLPHSHDSLLNYIADANRELAHKGAVYVGAA